MNLWFCATLFLGDEFNMFVGSFNTTEMLVEEQDKYKVMLLSTAVWCPSPGSGQATLSNTMSNSNQTRGQPFSTTGILQLVLDPKTLGYRNRNTNLDLLYPT